MSTSSTPRSPGTPDPGPDQEGAIESLLLDGLDAYFAGQYERAIHAWDRGHARARAYIERARQVVAERQREADASLQSGIEAFNNGDVEHARELLRAVVRERGADEQALALLKRLERLEARAPVPDASAPRQRGRQPAAAAPPVTRPSRKGYIILAVIGVAILAGASWLAVNWETFEVRRAGPPPLPASMLGEVSLPVPRLSASMLRQARALYARGHLHEALQAIAAVRENDPLRPEADRLRAEVQRALLAASGASQVAAEAPLELRGAVPP
jgi:thioredoxin-like negative regulator of GroEL